MRASEHLDNAKRREVAVNFIRTELDLGVTFVQTAEIQGDKPLRFHQAAEKALTAFDTALLCLTRVELTEDETTEIRGKIEALENCLRSIEML